MRKAEGFQGEKMNYGGILDVDKTLSMLKYRSFKKDFDSLTAARHYGIVEARRLRLKSFDLYCVAPRCITKLYTVNL